MKRFTDCFGFIIDSGAGFIISDLKVQKRITFSTVGSLLLYAILMVLNYTCNIQLA